MSVEMRVDIAGIEEFQRKMMRLDDLMRQRVWQGFNSVGASIKAEAKQLAPVRTGFLRSTIYAKMDPPSPFGMTQNFWQLIVGAWAKYARYQEFGTRYIRPRRFLSTALQHHSRQIIQVIQHAVQLAIEEASS